MSCLLQVSQVYKTIKIESLSKMLPFLDFSEMERISVEAVEHYLFSLKIDHVRGSVVFGKLVSYLIFGHLVHFGHNIPLRMIIV